MKKFVNIICIFSLCCTLSFAKEADVANRNTALRCLKLAENCLLAGDYDNAYNQAVLGLSYDENISDLIYIKANAEMAKNEKKANVIKDIEKAFEINEWVSYSVNGARLLYADLLSDVGLYDKSMKVLDEKPFILTADAEFIRIKNLYRMGTSSSINDARLKVNTSRRIYKDDNRFPALFFMFELKYMQDAFINQEDYEIPTIVKTIADSYIVDLPDYSGENSLIELMALFFADKSTEEKIDEQTRLVKAVAAKEMKLNPLIAIAGLNVGLYSQQEAFDMFFNLSSNNLELSLLESFSLMLTEDEVQKQFVEKLNNYEGIIILDIDNDLQPEVYISYKTGRPDEIKYDKNNDGIVDVFASCDFGLPSKIYFYNNNTTITYKSFPSVSRITFEDKDYSFIFIDNDLELTPFTLVENEIFSLKGLKFFVPKIEKNFTIPNSNVLINKAVELELKTKERNDSRVVYELLNGKPVYADFYNGNEKYAYCVFTKDFPLIRKVDYDGDGHFETEETYNVLKENETPLTKEENEFVTSVFHPLSIRQDIYLSMVRIDRNANTFYEFTEQYIGPDGKITSWDNNDDGIIDSQFIRYPMEKNAIDENIDNIVVPKKESLKEDSIFFDKNGEPYISINFIDKVPVKMNLQNQEVIISSGEGKNFYWIEDTDDDIKERMEIEKYIVEEESKNLSNGLMKIVDMRGVRASVIMVNDNIFCKIIPETLIENNENKPNSGDFIEY